MSTEIPMADGEGLHEVRDSLSTELERANQRANLLLEKANHLCGIIRGAQPAPDVNAAAEAGPADCLRTTLGTLLGRLVRTDQKLAEALDELIADTPEAHNAGPSS